MVHLGRAILSFLSFFLNFLVEGVEVQMAKEGSTNKRGSLQAKYNGGEIQKMALTSTHHLQLKDH